MASPQLSESQIDQILADAGWPSSQWGNAYGVISAESGDQANPTEEPASAAAGATGLFQVLAEHWQGLNWTAPAGMPHNEATYQELLTNPLFNAEQALELYEGSGWEPWIGDAYINANPELLNSPTAQGTPNSGPVGPLGPVGPTGSLSSTPISASASGTSSTLSRIVIGLIGIILLAVFASQLLKGDNSPGQVLIQGPQSVANHVKNSGKKAGEVAIAE